MESKNIQPHSSKEFRLEIIDHLWKDNVKYQNYKESRAVIGGAKHLPIYIIDKRQRQCQLCADSRSIFQCEKCEVPLCIKCFKPYHDRI